MQTNDKRRIGKLTPVGFYVSHNGGVEDNFIGSISGLGIFGDACNSPGPAWAVITVAVNVKLEGVRIFRHGCTRKSEAILLSSN